MYKGLICRVNCYPHPSDKYTNIQCASAKGHTVIVDKKTQSGDLGIFFPPDGTLSHFFCMANKLYRKDPETGEKSTGYLEENARIKAIKFGGVKSEGLWMPINTLKCFGEIKDYFVDGDEIDSVNGKELCKKYYTPATLKMMSKKQKQVKPTLKDKKSFVFPKHFDTAQFKYNFDKIPSGSMVYLTEKLHGTSARIALVNTETTHFSWWQKQLFKFGVGKFVRFKPTIQNNWEMLVGSRNVVLNEVGDWGGYYDSDKFRFNIANLIKDFFIKNEVVYGEIVGYTNTNKLIMNSASLSVLKDKNLSKQWGDQMIYKYGNAVGHCDFYVYRISNLNPDGIEIDLSWNQVKKRCKELGVKHVPEFESFIYDGDSNKLLEICNEYVDGSSILDSSHIREGVCVRTENDNGFQIYKHKSWLFGVLEGFIKDDAQTVDLEEIS